MKCEYKRGQITQFELNTIYIIFMITQLIPISTAKVGNNLTHFQSKVRQSQSHDIYNICVHIFVFMSLSFYLSFICIFQSVYFKVWVLYFKICFGGWGLLTKIESLSIFFLQISQPLKHLLSFF